MELPGVYFKKIKHHKSVDYDSFKLLLNHGCLLQAPEENLHSSEVYIPNQKAF